NMNACGGQCQPDVRKLSQTVLPFVCSLAGPFPAEERDRETRLSNCCVSRSSTAQPSDRFDNTDRSRIEADPCPGPFGSNRPKSAPGTDRIGRHWGVACKVHAVSARRGR